jgi:two-component system, NarL family, nitrate/nitrite response regulator NarL
LPEEARLVNIGPRDRPEPHQGERVIYAHPRGGQPRITASCNDSSLETCEAENVALRVVIVDDSPTFLDAARSLLERERLQVVGRASNSQEALHRVAETNPDVVLLDVSLGEESGLELTHRLADFPTSAGVPVILISTRSEEDLTDLLAECPILGFIPKSELSAAAIRRLMGSPQT